MTKHKVTNQPAQISIFSQTHGGGSLLFLFGTRQNFGSTNQLRATHQNEPWWNFSCHHRHICVAKNCIRHLNRGNFRGFHPTNSKTPAPPLLQYTTRQDDSQAHRPPTNPMTVHYTPRRSIGTCKHFSILLHKAQWHCNFLCTYDSALAQIGSAIRCTASMPARCDRMPSWAIFHPFCSPHCKRMQRQNLLMSSIAITLRSSSRINMRSEW